MAGAGYKLFQTGDVLTATEVNTYLQQQVTMVFANSTARTTALSGVLAEGMMSYLQDTNLVEVYDGSSWVSVGNTGDITGVTAGAGLTGGGTSGTVTLTNDMATTITAKGDLLVGTGSATYDNLAVGTNGYTLVADSATATGLKWAAPSASTPVYANITSGSITSGTTLTLSSLTSYDNLRLTLTNLNCGTTGSNIRIRFNGATTDYQNNSAVFYVNNSGSTFTACTVQAASSSIDGAGIFTGGFLSPGTSNTIFLNLFGCKSASGFTVGEMIAFYESSVATGEKMSYANVALCSNAALSSITVEWEDGYSFTGGTYRLIGA